jgi:predicted lipid-binding transport protein (Tim44 family)
VAPATLLRSLKETTMTMKPWLMAALVAGLALTLAPTLSEAARLGGGRPAGMQRVAPARPAPTTPPSNAATPAPAATPATPAAGPATPPARSWMGPLAGLAAGLGIAALFSHFGMGEGLADFVMIALLAVAAFVVIRLLLQRFGGAGAQRPPMALAGAGAQGQVASAPRFVDERPGMQREALTPAIGSDLKPPLALPGAVSSSELATPALPAGFDRSAFERLAKMIFIRMQAANDSADLNDLRNFTTPELFASLRLDLQERADVRQQTDVVKVDAQLIDFAEEAERQIVSVRFDGLIREVPGAEPAPFSEIWHLVKPADDSRSWAIAGIQPVQ